MMEREGSTGFENKFYYKSYTDGLRGSYIQEWKNLTLENVAYIPNFYVNIISGNLIRKLGLWLCEEEDTTRWGPLLTPMVVMPLKLREDLHIVEYNPISMDSPSLPASNDGIIAFPAFTSINATIRQIFRPSKDRIRERTDSAEM